MVVRRVWVGVVRQVQVWVVRQVQAMVAAFPVVDLPGWGGWLGCVGADG
jgi:hypothetical protein